MVKTSKDPVKRAQYELEDALNRAQGSINHAKSMYRMLVLRLQQAEDREQDVDAHKS